MTNADQTAPITIATMHVTTRCTSRPQFMTMFRRYCDRTSCFIPSPQPRSVGELTAFSIRLADGTLVLHGDGVVTDAWHTADNPFKRPGVYVEINQLTPESKELLEEMVIPRSSATRIPLATQLQYMQDTMPVAAPHLVTGGGEGGLPRS